MVNRLTIELLDNFKEYYRHFDQHPISRLNEFYSENVAFSDPIHRVDGLSHLQEYFTHTCEGLTSCHFEFKGETVDSASAWFKWEMHYQHPKLNSGRPLVLNGASYLKFENTDQGLRIVSHEDFYDMGQMLYEHTPLLGTGVRWLKQKLINAA